MATVSTLITSARYDLNDTGITDYTDAELLDYLNRNVYFLDLSLSKHKSDFTHNTETATTLADGDDSVAAPSGLINLRSLWIDDDLIDKKSIDYVYQRRKYISGSTGKPCYCALQNANIIFDYEADDDYTPTIHYDKMTGDLESANNMPYQDLFNQLIRQGVVLMAKNRNEYDVSGDAAIQDFIEQGAFQVIISRRHTPARYKGGF